MAKRKQKKLEIICDSCEREIVNTYSGWFEWFVDSDGIQRGFRIVHHDESCQYDLVAIHNAGKLLKDRDLYAYLGEEGLKTLKELMQNDNVDKIELQRIVELLHH